MGEDIIIKFVLCIVGGFLLSVIIAKVILPILASRHLNQPIFELGPAWHKSKADTPTMGGICFIIAVLAVMLVFVGVEALVYKSQDLLPVAFSLGLAVANGMIGFVDDYRKLVKKENEGLGRTSKLLLQLGVAIAYLVLMKIFGNLNTSLVIPFTNVSFELGALYYILAALIIAGFVNATNITDGIDGLASSITFVVLAFFSVVAFRIQDANLAILAAAFIGAILGFLMFNRHPAKMFMGDTGSLFIGGFLMGLAFMINNPLILVIAGMVYIIEMLSSFLQIFCYKMFNGKRLFSIAPFHHALEKRGWSENKIVVVFSAVTLAFCVIAYLGL